MAKREISATYLKVPKMVVKVKDVFVLNDIVKILEEWLKEYGYKDMEGTDDVPETLQTYRVSGGGSWLDAWMWWRAVRYPAGTTSKTAYLRYLMNIDMHYLGEAKEVEVMHKGKKVKLNKGEIEITLQPIIEFDFRNEWKKEGIMGLLQDVFKKKIYKKDIDDHFQLLLIEGYKLQGMLKQYFKVEAFVAEETVAQPSKGLM
jgi:hypothetical protein